VLALHHVPVYALAQPTALAAPYTQSVLAESVPAMCFNHVMNGTGGNCSLQFYRERYGYRPFQIIERKSTGEPVPVKPFARLMTEIKEGFGRTLTRLPTVFGVSRQTLYNWLDGETPKEPHQAKLVELTEAARVFAAAGFKPTSTLLDRTVAGGKSFLELIANGADGAATARSLMRIVERGLTSKAHLAAALADVPAAPRHSGDIGAPAAEEDA